LYLFNGLITSLSGVNLLLDIRAIIRNFTQKYVLFPIISFFGCLYLNHMYFIEYCCWGENQEEAESLQSRSFANEYSNHRKEQSKQNIYTIFHYSLSFTFSCQVSKLYHRSKIFCLLKGESHKRDDLNRAFVSFWFCFLLDFVSFFCCCMRVTLFFKPKQIPQNTKGASNASIPMAIHSI